MSELVSGGIGFVLGLFVGRAGVPAAIPRYLEDIAKNVSVIVVMPPDRMPCKLKPLYYYEFPYRWGPVGSPVYTRKDGVFAFIAPKFAGTDWANLGEGDVEVLIDIIDWTDNPGAYQINIDLCRMDTAEVEVYYKGVLLLTFPSEYAPNTPLSGYAIIPIDPDTGDVILGESLKLPPSRTVKPL